MAQAYITPDLFGFFRELKENNNRAWFEENKPRFEQVVREPLLEFIEDFGIRLTSFARNYIADARKSGGSLFRIYRDIRFSKDKTPYKTAAGIQFRHEMGKDVHAPGFYLHLEPDAVFCGLGIWRPDTKTALRIREYIVEDVDSWKKVREDTNFNRHFELQGESLKRPPRGFDPEHPYLDDLKRKDFIAGASLSERDACSPGFIDLVEERFRAGVPFVRFLTKAVGLAW